jgi:uncharacterized protein (TIGR03437 family)
MVFGRTRVFSLILFSCLGPWVGSGEAQTIAAVLNGASYSTSLAPGTLTAIFGSNLAGSGATAQSVPLPLKLGDVSVTVGGLSAPLLYVSAGQVNALIPFELPAIAPGSTVTVPLVLTNSAGSVTQQITLRRNAPGIFTLDGSGTGNAIVLTDGFQFSNAVGSDPIILYATGLGPVTNPVASDAGASAADSITDFLSVQLGYRDATVQYAGLAPGLPGVYQINLVPNSPVTNSLQIVNNGIQSNALTVPMNMGSNISNATGSINPLYPTNSTNPISMTELLLAANFKVDLQIKGGAQPFDITAMSAQGTGLATIHVDPMKGTWQAALTEPSATARQYNFADVSGQVYDLQACQQGANGVQCNAFAGNVVPQNRVDPAAISALGAIPQPNGGISPNASYTSSGSLPADGHLVISNLQLGQLSAFAELSAFAAFQQIGTIYQPSGSTQPYTIQFQLFADGVLLDSKNVTAQIQ